MRAAITHHGFAAVHPFEDGNGHCGRLRLNLMLMRDGYPSALLLREWRDGCLIALDTANNGNYRPLGNLIGRSVESVLDRYWYSPSSSRCRWSSSTMRPVRYCARLGTLMPSS